MYQFFTVKNEKDVKLSTNVRPLKLSKLTIREFHIFKKRRIGTNSSHGVKFAVQQRHVTKHAKDWVLLSLF